MEHFKENFGHRINQCRNAVFNRKTLCFSHKFVINDIVIRRELNAFN